jgi:alkaline phosphatase
LAGVKTRIGVIGHDGRAILGNCTSSLNNKIDSILQWAHRAGKSVGIVTTTRITHATPAGAVRFLYVSFDLKVLVFYLKPK